MAQEHVVSANAGAKTKNDPTPSTSADSDSTATNYLRFLLDNEAPSLDDFVHLAMDVRLGIQKQNYDFINSYKKKSTENQYRSSWKKWVEFVQLKSPTCINMDFCISFFKSLHDRGLASSTINSVKSSLTVPINTAFGINLNSDLFNKIPKACAQLRPSIKSPPISWSLGKVLDYASSIDNESADLKLLLRKSIFLLAMATGARLSELAALTRDPEHVLFKESGEVTLYPDPTFLAKNEDPYKRWDPWNIPPLPEEPSLCPVRCLQAYLNRTPDIHSGQLFRGESYGSNLSIKQIRYKMGLLIKHADPLATWAGHDPRKVSTSLNFLHFMSFSDLQQYTGWKSPKVFFRHYLKNIQDVRHNVVAAGKVVRAAET